jgi:hypothetical protein
MDRRQRTREELRHPDRRRAQRRVERQGPVPTLGTRADDLERFKQARAA